ncbi:MAG: hypothetical protein LBO79_06240 [Zoogloeaceae bacterium]|jgi:CRISPR-associated protein Cmr3|nr:hypothetical protein [Zoogloeaceae bacterium]
MTTTFFLEPLDVLFLRGNKLFGDPGSHGEAQMPPNPSVAAGAIRSRMLVDAGIDLAAFARGEISHPVLGTPREPGEFALTAFHLARRENGMIAPLFAPPADLNLEAPEKAEREEEKKLPPQVKALQPLPAPQGILTSFPLPGLPILAQKKRDKPVSGYWLTAAGWARYLAGGLPDQKEHWLERADLWQIDERVGIGMDAATRSVAEGRLFTVQAVALKPGVGFLAAVTGAELSEGASLRFGGDGRAVAVRRADVLLPEPDYAALARARRCRLILASPGIFAAGWLPTGATLVEGNTAAFALHGVRGKITAAAVSRFETVSGWDLANWRPKPAQCAVPTGSVYWLDELEADADALRALAEQGLWSETPSPEDRLRRAEGFNRCALAAWN